MPNYFDVGEVLPSSNGGSVLQIRCKFPDSFV